MRATIRAIVAFSCALVLCACAAAQLNPWAAVQGLADGSTVEVRLSPTATVKGKLVAVSAAGMDIQTRHGSTRHVDRAQVTRVYLVSASHKRRGALIGAGIGVAGGAFYTLGKYKCYPADQGGCASKALTYAVVSAYGAAIGAAIGAVVGHFHSKLLVYDRKHDRKPGPTDRGQKSAQRHGAMSTAKAAGPAR